MEETNKIPQEWNKFYLKDVSFVNLMTRRIFNVLIVANPYDAFMLEDDGRIDEKIFDEYMELGMRYPPTFTQVSTTEEANEVLHTTDIDLVICMPGNADNDAFTVAREVKAAHPTIPCVVLTPFSHGITKRIENEDMSVFDYVFCWLGNTNLIMSIIKLLEDKMNIEHDIKEAGVQMILLVEDNIRFYSSVLPNLYNYILAQSKYPRPVEAFLDGGPEPPCRSPAQTRTPQGGTRHELRGGHGDLREVSREHAGRDL